MSLVHRHPFPFATFLLFPGALSVGLAHGARSEGSLYPDEVLHVSTSIEQSIAGGDVNGDGHMDLATFNGADVSVLLGAGDGTFRDPVVSGLGIDGWDLILRDFDGDGKLDVAATGGISTPSRWLWAMATARSARRRITRPITGA